MAMTIKVCDGSEVTIVAIRAVRYFGRGTAMRSYEGKDASGHWHPFLKKDNSDIAKLKPAGWGPRQLHKYEGGVRFSEVQRSDEITV
jgi:hypothetical protein